MDEVTEWDVPISEVDYSFEDSIPDSSAIQAELDWQSLLDEIMQSSATIGNEKEEEVFVTPSPKPVVPTFPLRVKPQVYNQTKLDPGIERRIRLTQVLGKFASTVALKPIRVEIDSYASTNVPAYSDASTIYLASHAIRDLTTPESVVVVKGLGLHETSHIVFTPRNSTKIVQWANTNNMLRAMNALEDQRIETSMVTMFRSTSDWLIGTVAEHLLKCSEEDETFLYPIIHGRKYLDRAIRDHIKSVYANQGNVQELGDLIDEYITLDLTDAKMYPRAQEIIERYAQLIDEQKVMSTSNPEYVLRSSWETVNDINGHGSRPCEGYKTAGNKGMEKKQAAALAKRVANEVEKDKQEGEGQGQGQGTKAGQGEEKGEGEGKQSDVDRDSDDFQLSDTVGNGLGTGNKGLTTKAWANKVIQTVIDRNSRSIEQTLAQISGTASLDSKAMKPLPRNEVWNKEPSPEAVVATRGFQKELEFLRAEFDPSWHKRVDSGRLNIQRLFTGGSFDEAFDLWDQGVTDAMDIECVILLDTSGSMGYQMRQAFEYMWVIKRALDKINASTTVSTFSHKNELLYSANEKATTYYRAAEMGDNTKPIKSLNYAQSILANSARAIKLLIVITDGVWDDPNQCNNVIRHLSKGGVITSLALLSDDDKRIDSHGCDLAVVIKEPKDLNALARNIVKSSVLKHANRR